MSTIQNLDAAIQSLQETINTITDEGIKSKALEVLKQVKLAMDLQLEKKYYYSRKDATKEELIDVLKSTEQFLQAEITIEEYAAKAKTIYSDNTPGRKALGVAMCALGAILIASGIAALLALNAALVIGAASLIASAPAILLALSPDLMMLCGLLTLLILAAIPEVLLPPVLLLLAAPELMAFAPAAGGYCVIREGIGFFSGRKPTSDIAKSMDDLRTVKEQQEIEAPDSDNKSNYSNPTIDPIYPTIPTY